MEGNKFVVPWIQQVSSDIQVLTQRFVRYKAFREEISPWGNSVSAYMAV
jgi:hypothetical protein